MLKGYKLELLKPIGKAIFPLKALFQVWPNFFRYRCRDCRNEEHVRDLLAERDALRQLLKAIVTDLQAKIDQGDDPVGRYISGEYWARAIALTEESSILSWFSR